MALLLTFSTSLADQPIVLVEDGQAKATIVYTGSGGNAAGVLQSYLAEITGVALPRVSESSFDGQGTAIVVGMGELAQQMGIEVKQDREDGDHYVIRTEDTSFGKHIAVVGNDDGLTGSVYVAYDLLQRMGCGWFGPDSNPAWQVIPQKTTLTLRPVNVDERAAFRMRSIWGLGWGTKVNYAWRTGGLEMNSGHNLGYLVPSNEYPQYYDGRGQPCLVNPEVVEIIVGKLREQLNSTQETVLTLSLTANDNASFHNCAECQAIGNVSAQSVYFVNNVARELSKTHPNRFKVNFLAYWATHRGPSPMRRCDPAVNVMFVNEGNHMQPWENMPEPPVIAAKGRNNTREVRDFAAWQQTGRLTGIYEWWVPGLATEAWKYAPWYSGDTAIRNLRYWHKSGVRYVIYEAWYNNGDGHPERWPLFYAAARGMWDPGVTSDEIMTDACQKLFGPAAQQMFMFYKTLEKAMTDPVDISGGNWGLPHPATIYTPQVVNRATEYLQAAAAIAAAAGDEGISQRIADEQQMWQQARDLMN